MTGRGAEGPQDVGAESARRQGPADPQQVETRPAGAWEAREMEEQPQAQAQVRRLPLRGSAGAVTRCRDFTKAALVDWGWLPARTTEGRERAEDVLLLVSEVVTNACLHAGGPQELVLRQSGSDGRLRIEVSDGSPDRPRAHSPRSPAQPGGHGLMVLDRLAGAWGSAEKSDGSPGKVVWVEVARPSRGPWLRHQRPGTP
ncbi:ATP-binding protein [Streptomyces sp. NPDC053493]|uniref:ATP-binding protein n=1 Tax=Streptomyces sp. NPDC053493 TaxID=3365705 RepID=UPI0037D10011